MKYLPIFFLTLIILMSFVPVVQAVAFEPLVSCGKDTTPCTLDDFWTFLARIVKFLTGYIGIPIAVLGIGVGGFYIIIGSNSEGDRTKGKDIIYASVIGLLIALSAWLIVNTLLKGLGVDEGVVKNPLKQNI